MTLNLSQLHQEMRACRLCYEAGHDIVPGAVFSSGTRPWVMLIGQAPGVTEVTAKRPFNASSGRRLFEWLGEAGWDEDTFRQTQYMTAVTKCYPGKNNSGKGDRVPTTAEQALCRPFLRQEMALIKPRLIILVGKLATSLLYPKSARLKEIVGTAVYFPPDIDTHPLDLTHRHGQRVTQVQNNPHGRYVVPLPHPSGASLWPNKPANKALIGRAIDLLQEIRMSNEQ